MASDVHSGRETVAMTGDGEQDVPAGGGPTVPGDLDVDVAASGTAEATGSRDGNSAADASRTADTTDTTDTTDTADGDAVVAESASAPQAEPETGAVPGRRRTILILLAMAALALLLDVVSKHIVVATLSHRGPVRLPGGFLYLTLLRNSGAAFSIGEGQTWLFTVIAAAVALVILRVSRHLRSVPWACALGLLLGGALGNLGDRIFRSPGLFRGNVVDFLQFPTFPVVHYDFPVFNLADSAIVVGGGLMVLLSFLGIQTDGTRHHPDKPENADRPERPAKSEDEDA